MARIPPTSAAAAGTTWRRGGFLRRVAVVSLATAVTGGLAAPVRAQGDVVQHDAQPPASSCLASIADSALTRMPVWGFIALADTTQPVPASAANLLQAVADRVDSLLGGAPRSLPDAEPTLTWRDIGRGLQLTWYRDGRLIWRVPDDTLEVDVRGDGGARLLARALSAARDASEAPLVWPDDVAADSMQLGIDFLKAWIDSARAVHPAQVRKQIPHVPLFIISEPWRTEVTVRRISRIPYPDELLGRVSGQLLLEWVVDTMGRADRTTIHDLWPMGQPRLTGDMARYYDAFLAGARNAVMGARYTPERIVGCKVPQRVQQPFIFKTR